MIDKVALIYVKDKKILSTRSKGKDKYYLPGGKREGNETDQDTLIREIKEELSVDVISGSMKLYGIFEAQAHGKAPGIIVRMTCYTADFEGTIIADNEIDEVVWLTYEDINNVSPVDKLIFDKLMIEQIID